MKKKLLAILTLTIMIASLMGCAAQQTPDATAGNGVEPSSLQDELSMTKVNDAAELAKAKIESEYNSITDMLYVISLLEGENNAYAKSVNDQIVPIHDRVLSAVDDIVAVNKENMSSPDYYEQKMNEQSLQGISDIYDSWNSAYVSIHEELKVQYAQDIETIAENIDVLTGNITQINEIFLPDSPEGEEGSDKTGMIDSGNAVAADAATADAVKAQVAAEAKKKAAQEAADAQAALEAAQAQQAALEAAQAQAALEAAQAQAALEAAQAAQAAAQ